MRAASRFTPAELIAVAERGFGVTAPVMAGALAAAGKATYTRAEAMRAVEDWKGGDA